MSKRCPECRYRMEHDGVVDNDDVYYCDVCGIYQSYPLEEATLAAEGKNCGCGKDPCVTYGAESEKKLKMVSPSCLACGNDRATIDYEGDKFCYDCYHYAESFGADEEFYEEYPAKYYQIDEDEGVFHLPTTDSYWLVHGEDALTKEQFQKLSFGAETFNSYKVAPELSSYTVDELVASKAGPQGSASYDEMVYDPIAQNRLSAESSPISQTLLLIGAIAAGLGFGVFLTKNLNPSTPETSDEGGA